jgi:hypothetical protein
LYRPRPRASGALPSIDLSGLDLARELGASDTRLTDQGVDIQTMRLSGRAVQRENYFLIQTAMMFLRALF